MSESTRRPNIVLLMSDQHNPAVMGCAGNSIVQTPHLDALVEGGIRFTNAYCSYPLCAPSRAAFMAAQYPSDIGVYDNSGSFFFCSQTPTFAHALGAAGYEAVLCGRMHFGTTDPFHGFERCIHGDVSGNMLTPEILGSGYYKTAGQTKYAVEVSGYGKTGYQAFDHSVTDTACEFIRSRRDSDRPYALVVGLILPHNPLICAKDLFEYYMEQIPPLELQSQEYLNNLHPALKKWRQRRGVDDLTPEQNRRGLAAYSGLVTEMDRNVGRIIKAIRTQPSVDNTVIIYTSDHGDMACEHGMWWKSSFYEGSVSVPLIFSWPGHFQKNKTENSIVSLIDVGPTVLDIASAAPLPDVSGKSFAGFLTGEDIPDWSNEVFAEYCGLWGDQPSCMIRTGPWKLNYYHEFLSCQLFNIKVDPDEQHDRANDPDCAEVVKFCLQKIHARWSAEALLENFAKQERAREVLQSCGHAAVPHEVGRFTTPEGCNEFDFSQLPKVPSSSAVK